MDKEISECIRGLLVALLYDPAYTVVSDRASLGEDREICGFQGEADTTASFKYTIAALVGSMHEVLRRCGAKLVWFDVRASRKPDHPHAWELMALLGVAAAGESKK